MGKSVLITGGTGLVGKNLAKKLTNKGYEVSFLSRRKRSGTNEKYYVWDISREYIEEGAIENADYIIHLAGAGVADKRWTDERKREIIQSRTISTELIYQQLNKTGHTLKGFISASAIGYYGNTGTKWITEEQKPANDFLAKVCIQWEKSIQSITDLGIPTSVLRIGVVLTEKGGALEKMALPVRMMAGAALGSGKQYVSWVHIKDLCNMFVFLLENHVTGTFNGVAPNPVTNTDMIKEIANVLRRPTVLPNVPDFVLKMMMGEMAEIVLLGSRVSAEKIERAGFQFQYETLKPALKNLLK